jgi:hypothetical protein
MAESEYCFYWHGIAKEVISVVKALMHHIPVISEPLQGLILNQA